MGNFDEQPEKLQLIENFFEEENFAYPDQYGYHLYIQSIDNTIIVNNSDRVRSTLESENLLFFYTLNDMRFNPAASIPSNISGFIMVLKFILSFENLFKTMIKPHLLLGM